MRMTLTVALTLTLMVGGTALFAQDVVPAAEEPAAPAQPAAMGDRVADGLVALYRFDELLGDLVIPDAATTIGGVDLIVSGEPLETVSVHDGAVHFIAPSEATVPGVFSSAPATAIVDAIRASGQFTLEAWLTPASDNQTGPARIVTISRDSSVRNVTLGQTGNSYIVRLRTSGTNEQGSPDMVAPAGTVSADELQHVVVTFDGQTTTIYVDGNPVADSTAHAGSLAGWDPSMSLVLGNEFDGNRRWFGSIHLVAFYAQALSPNQVRTNFDAGL